MEKTSYHFSDQLSLLKKLRAYIFYIACERFNFILIVFNPITWGGNITKGKSIVSYQIFSIGCIALISFYLGYTDWLNISSLTYPGDDKYPILPFYCLSLRSVEVSVQQLAKMVACLGTQRLGGGGCTALLPFLLYCQTAKLSHTVCFPPQH